MIVRGLCLALLLHLTGCARKTGGPDVSHADFRPIALAFGNALAARDYGAAYALTARPYRARVAPDQMKAAFEQIVPLEQKHIGPIELGQTLTEWPGKQAGDLGWAYVSVGGDVASEAVVVVVCDEGGQPKIRDVEWGRP